MENEKILFEIKPKYNAAYITIVHFFDIVVFVFILAILGTQQGMLKNVIITGIVALVLYLAFLRFKIKRNKKCFYRFYNDKLVYCNTYFIRKIKQIKYSEMKEIRYSQGFIQSKFNLGEIYILTNGNILNKIINFNNIPNVKKNYEKILSLFNT